MSIYFPRNPSPGAIYPKPGDIAELEKTGGIVYQYDPLTNSWNIVGPDNVASTDWVLAQLDDDKTALERGYDLVSATSDITIDSNYNYVSGNAAANSNLESGIRGSVLEDLIDYDVALATQLDDWEHVTYEASVPGATAFTIAGINKRIVDDSLDQGISDPGVNVFSTQYRDIVEFFIHQNDREGVFSDIFNNMGIGDTLEVSFEGSDGNFDYSIYKVKQVTEYKDRDENSSGDTEYLGIRVEYHSSSSPEKEMLFTSTNTYYRFTNYKKSFSAEGGDISGYLRLTNTDPEVLSVKGINETEHLFIVNTSDNDVNLNSEHDHDLDYDNDKTDTAVVTKGHLNRRLGSISVSDNTKGPYLQIKGGTLNGTTALTINRSGEANNNAGTFIVQGRKKGTDINTQDLLYVYHKSSGDEIHFEGSYNNDKSLMPKKAIKDQITSDLSTYLPKAGGQSNSMTGQLYLLEQDPTAPQHAANKAYVDSRPLVVPEEDPNLPGALWSDGGTLYWNQR
jgi:hypothetical protein